jgi:hypothetical protein
MTMFPNRYVRGTPYDLNTHTFMVVSREKTESGRRRRRVKDSFIVFEKG